MMNVLLDAATDELHAQLSVWAHDRMYPSGIVVRRLLPQSNTITIDISRTQQPSGVDRFVIKYHQSDPEGKTFPTAIMATAGTLTTVAHEETFCTFEALQKWIQRTAQVCNL